MVGLLEAAPDAVVCVDSDGRIVLVNAQTERLFGYGREELTGQLVEILVPDAIRASHPGLRAGYMADPRPRQMGAGLELAAAAATAARSWPRSRRRPSTPARASGSWPRSAT